MSETMRMSGSAIRCELTSKQEKKVRVKGGGIGKSLILTHSRVGYCFPDSIIRDALVSVVETESPAHGSASGGK